MSVVPTYPLRVLAVRLRMQGDASGSDTWVLVSEQDPEGRYLAAILFSAEPWIQWLPDQGTADDAVSQWVEDLTGGPAADYEFVGVEEKHISVAGLTDTRFEQRWWALALRSNLNGEPFNRFYPSRSRRSGKFRAFEESYGGHGHPGPGGSSTGGAVWRKHSPPTVSDGDREYVAIDDLLGKSWR